ncbi:MULTISPECIES: hypothetical protein [Subtercola]|uniref:Uncharacterized protein n=1 Tax=Subtercola vilae TaxID=2056433 RepID=A0A4T2BVM1_9MICO|nr:MULTISPECIES: hypothetical protein [Subtercola]MEA9984486.1 hypothetical protein [Subtercola sp. RTI3]TIH33836.1 hypothetical protein D4765_13760 [Subtercola vilae]
MNFLSPSRQEAIDIAIGILGFFALAFFVITVVAELTGTAALGWALTLLVLVLLLAGLLRLRTRVARQLRDDEAASAELRE